MSTDDKKVVSGDPRDERPEVGGSVGPVAFEVDKPLIETAEAASDVLAGKTLKASQAEDPMAKTLDQFLKELEQEKTPTAVDKARKIQRVLMFVGRHVDIKTNKILLKKQPGLIVGEAFEGHVEFDPILFDNERLTEDHLTIMRHALLHELFHMEKDIPNEGLAEVAASRLSLDKIRDYDNLVQNVLQVTYAMGAHFHNGDKDGGVLETVQLYSEKKYDELFARFEKAYNAMNPKAVESNPDVAEKVFQLAFPELAFEADESGTAKWREDEETTEEVRAKVDAEDAGAAAGAGAAEKAPVEEAPGGRTPPEETPVE